MASCDASVTADKNKSREQLLQELASLRSRLAAKEQECQTLQELAKSDRNPRCQLMFETMSEGFALHEIILDADGKPFDYRFLEINPAFERLTGLKYEAVIGKTVREVIPAIEPYWIEAYGRVALEGASVRIENYSAPLNGWYEAYAYCTAHKQFAVLFTNITERKRSQEAFDEARRSLERERNLLQLMIDSARNLHLAYLDRDFNFVRVNEAYAKTCGYAPDEMVAKNHFELYPHAENEAIFANVRDSGVPIEYHDKPFVFPDQPERGITYWDWTLTPAKDRSGAVKGLIFSLFETTERKRAEEELRESERRYHRLFEDDLTGDFICSPDGEILLCNSSFAAIFGFSSPDEAIGTRMSELRDDASEGDPILEVLKRQGKLEKYETWRKRRDGKRIYVVENLVGHFNDRAELYEVQGYIFDDTERKCAEEAVLELNKQLEQRVSERTALAEARANQLQALAVELIEAEEKERRRFAHLLHDDLQQLLAAARMQLLAFSESLPHEPTLAYVGQLLEESIGKSRQLSHELSPSVFQHPDFTTALVWLSERMKQQFGLNVKMQSADEQRIESAPLRRFLFRAVQELLFNVIKHAGVKYALISLARSDIRFRVRVEDNGSGFDPAKLETSHRSAGLGLLSIRERANYFGGNLEIESAPGQGSRFTLTVPLELPKAEKIRKHETNNQDIATNAEELSVGKCLRIILADDHKVMRQGLTRLIGGQPDLQIVGEAANGREAVELSRELKPDVVVMDISMPEMDGIEATKMIKSELPQVYVVGLTMHDEEYLLQAMIHAGAEANISKTASSSELLRAIYATQSRNPR